MIRAVWLHLKNLLAKNPLRLFFSFVLLVCGLFMMSFLFLVQKNAKLISQSWKNKVEVIAYLNRDLTQDEKTSLETELQSRGDVESASYKTALENQTEFTNLFPELAQSAADQLIVKEALASTYEVKLKDPQKAEDVSQFLSSKDFVSNASFGQGIAKEIFQLVEMVRGLSYGTIGLFSLFGFALLQLAIFMSVFSKKQEIEIFNLLGTPKNLIKLPFAIEGMVLSFFAGIFGLGAAHLVFTTAAQWIQVQQFGASLGAQLQSFDSIEAFVIVILANGVGFLLGHKSTQFLIKDTGS